jgi:hypothetical protein
LPYDQSTSVWCVLGFETLSLRGKLENLKRMKRFGLPLLLSAGYASLLFGIFSSDFSKEHSFLLTEEGHTPRARAMENPQEGRENGLADRIASLTVQDLDPQVDKPIHHSPAEQSPESAGNTQP